MRIRLLIFAVACYGFMATAGQASCGTASCSVNTDAETLGVEREKKLAIDLHYEFIGQNQLRAGSRKVAIGEIRRHHDEVRTINRNFIATLDYRLSPAWGVALQAPLVSRTHDHNHNHHGAVIPEQWSFTELGDTRVLGRYYFAEEKSTSLSASFNFGVKLPSGSTDVTNAKGDRAERSLQPGSGSTDVLFGASYRRQFAANPSISWFASALWQKPVATRGAYEPGARLSLDMGLRHDVTERLTALLQLNSQWRRRDRGHEAESEDSGGTFVNISPGVRYALTPDLDIYGFLQQPIYQHVNGVQLTADWSALAGMSQRF
ncbi:MAG: TonB-dependent receptor [Gammaproteobacteria bacterium]|nr:TonB-dependent receptor [Gammaproteobacteria bacterium]